MSDLNACSVCGFTSNNLNTFENHIKFHEEESENSNNSQFKKVC